MAKRVCVEDVQAWKERGCTFLERFEAARILVESLHDECWACGEELQSENLRWAMLHLERVEERIEGHE